MLFVAEPCPPDSTCARNCNFTRCLSAVNDHPLRRLRVVHCLALSFPNDHSCRPHWLEKV